MNNAAKLPRLFDRLVISVNFVVKKCSSHHFGNCCKIKKKKIIFKFYLSNS